MEFIDAILVNKPNPFKLKEVNITKLEKLLDKVWKEPKTPERKVKYGFLRRKLEKLRGDWDQVPPYGLPSSKMKRFRNQYGYFPDSCGGCFNLPAGSSDCLYYGCNINLLLKEIFTND